MPTPHNEANIDDIAKTVIMPGDPLRAKYIVENFLEDYRLVSSVRNIYAYTGTYKGTPITIMASGMGIPSMGIYSYELYKFYDVDNIIRVGSCGGWNHDLKLFDIILSDSSYTESNFAFTMNNEKCNLAKADSFLNSTIEDMANELNINIFKGTTVCSECFDFYIKGGPDALESRTPKELNPLGVEMEAFSLFYTAKVLNKKAACILSIVDLGFAPNTKATAEERETGLNNMIRLALESATKF